MSDIPDSIQMNPIGQAQHEVAELLRACSWFAGHTVEIVEQDAQGLRFLLQKSIAQVKGVVLVVGCDRFSNDNPALEMTLTVTCVENVLNNRISDNSVSALQVAQAAIAVVDGEWWHFDECNHESPTDGVLQATATFRGLVLRTNTAQESA